MKRSLFIFTYAGISAALLLLAGGCGHERIGCEGEIVVENPIPDIILYISGELFIRDVAEPAVVFVHVNGQELF